MSRTVVFLSVLTTIALLGLSNASAAEELWVIKDGVLNKAALTPRPRRSRRTTSVVAEKPSTASMSFRTQYKGLSRTLRVSQRRSRPWETASSRSSSPAPSAGRQWRFPNITITDRGRLCFWKTGSPIILNSKRMALPLKGFHTPIEKNRSTATCTRWPSSASATRSRCYYDDKKLTEQPIDPDVRLYLWFDASLRLLQDQEHQADGEEKFSPTS